MPTKEELLKGFTIGEWEILPGQGVFRRGEVDVHPEPLVFRVLYSLAQRDGECVTRDDLIDDAWDGRPTSDDPINRSIAQLRGHLDDKSRPHQYVETLHRRGYRLMKPVELHQKQAAAAEIKPGLATTRRWKVVAAVMGLALLVSIALTMRSPEPDTELRSIAILPIENLIGDPTKQHIVEGIQNALARRLSEVPELSIKNTRVRYDTEPSEIATQLNVDSVLSGAVQLQGSVLKVTYLVSRGTDNVTIGSGEVNGEMGGIFALQERLANAVLKKLTGQSAPRLITLHTPNSDAYDSYMRGMYALEHRGETDDLENAIELFRQSIKLDEFFGPAYLSLATAYALLPYYRGSPVSETSHLAIETAEKGIAVDANIEDSAGFVYGRVYHNEKRWSESEQAYKRAVSARVVDSNAFNWYSRMLASVGRLDDALEQILIAAAIDPDNAIINSRVAIAYTWLGESERAHEYFERASSLGATGTTTHLLPYTLLLVQEGRYEEAAAAARSASESAGVREDWVAPVFAGFRDAEHKEAALRAVEEAVADETLNSAAEVTTRVILGDIDGAMAIAQRLVEPGEIFEMDLLYTPEFRALREHPDFLPLLERVGVIDYWKQAGCTFNGHKAVCESN